MAENITDFKCEHPDQWVKNEINFRSYLNRKQFIEMGLVAIFCLLIFALGYWHLIGVKPLLHYLVLLLVIALSIGGKRMT